VNKSVNQIKKDLRFIKSKQKAINTYITLEEQYSKRLDWLKSQKQSQSIQKDITRTKQILDALKSEFNIKRLQEMEEFYIRSINKLEDEYDRLVLFKVYINGLTFWRASEELSYSVDGLKDRAAKALIKLKIAIEKE
jgi:hypothetical protein